MYLHSEVSAVRATDWFRLPTGPVFGLFEVTKSVFVRGFGTEAGGLDQFYRKRVRIE